MWMFLIGRVNLTRLRKHREGLTLADNKTDASFCGCFGLQVRMIRESPS